ncbi:hypothetical protein HPB51_013659 [Rhipicephalus microplus]|uniref:Uncharacterized protein n=1 Tax=Rhipicephalus microplus TaxID=6941 RepID=A0A9J6E0Z4_RHIMP|nr:hypothetical protein HPB51_013659 [Rhipicephalus microplus]
MFALCRQALRRALVSPTLAPTLLANNFSVAATLHKLQEDWFMPAPERWPKKNDEIEPPQEPGQPRNQAWVRRPCRYCHYFVRLVEGPPPEHYYDPPLTPQQKLEEFIQELRDRRVKYGT